MIAVLAWRALLGLARAAWWFAGKLARALYWLVWLLLLRHYLRAPAPAPAPAQQRRSSFHAPRAPRPPRWP